MSHKPTLYTKGMVVTASYVGGPLGAGYLISQNYKALHDAEIAKKTLRTTVIGTLLLIVFFVLIPRSITEKIPSIVFPIAYTTGISAWVKKNQEQKIEDGLQTGHHKSSWWKVIGISIASMLITLAVFIALSFAYLKVNYLAYLQDHCAKYDEEQQMATKLYVPEDASCFVYKRLQGRGYTLSMVEQTLSLEFKYQKEIGMVSDSPLQAKISAAKSDYNPVPYIQNHQKIGLSTEQIDEILGQEIEYLRKIGVLRQQ